LWRPIIHLNLLRSVNLILELVVRRLDTQSSAERTQAGNSQGHQRAESNANLDIIRRLKFSLLPLKQTEEALSKRIGFTPDHAADPWSEPIRAPLASTTGRRKTLFRFKKEESSNPIRTERDKKEEYSNRRIISACAEDMVKLWENADVQRWLQQEQVNLLDKPGLCVYP
jgi:guanine nucleotide-binding protein alpha-1 subunit